MRWWMIFTVPVLLTGIFFRQYLAVGVLVSWISVECWVKYRGKRHALRLVGGLKYLLTLYGKDDSVSHRILDSRLQELSISGELSQEQRMWIERLRSLVELRSLLFGKNRDDRQGLVRSSFVYSLKPLWSGETQTTTWSGVTQADIIDAGTRVAELYWKMFEMASGGELSGLALALYQEIFGHKFERGRARDVIEVLTDLMQRSGGLPYVILNLVQLGRGQSAVSLMRELTETGTGVAEEERTALYWIAELATFDENKVSGFDESIKYLYQLCMVAPEKAEFLEIDSPFFPQFDILNEMAREGFLFKESLVESLIEMWSDFSLYDATFSKTMSKLLGVVNKIFDKRDIWIRQWKLVQPNLGREYLWVVEGNLAYHQRDYVAALECYNTALEVSPELEIALLNRLFALAQLKKHDKHDEAVAELLQKPHEKILYMCGDSYLLTQRLDKAIPLFEELRKCEGWETKIEYYQSQFCFENGLLDLALTCAEKAALKEPHSTAVRFHLGRCLDACGKKDRALEVVNAISAPPDWVNFYRFTLQRDAGHVTEAKKTLMSLPRDYFQEEADLNAAVDFAKSQKDLTLLRYLKGK